MRADFELTKVLVAVKTYPNPSEKYDETVCTAVVTETGKWLRIYPVNYRDLPKDKQYNKWQWMEIGLTSRGHRGDPRPESREPDVNSIRLLGEPLPTKNAWEARRRIIDGMPHSTLNELERQWEVDRTSLGIIRPAQVLDLEVREGDRKWSPKHEAHRAMPRLFGQVKTLHKIPFNFHYVFRCPDHDEPHRLLLEDWELGALFLNERIAKGEDAAVQSVRQKFLDDLCGPGKDTRFFVGTRHPFNQWMVIGVFYPPQKPKASGTQGTAGPLFSS